MLPLTACLPAKPTGDRLPLHPTLVRLWETGAFLCIVSYCILCCVISLYETVGKQHLAFCLGPARACLAAARSVSTRTELYSFLYDRQCAYSYTVYPKSNEAHSINSATLFCTVVDGVCSLYLRASSVGMWRVTRVTPHGLTTRDQSLPLQVKIIKTQS